jgi:hypothetical protein
VNIVLAATLFEVRRIGMQVTHREVSSRGSAAHHKRAVGQVSGNTSDVKHRLAQELLLFL